MTTHWKGHTESFPLRKRGSAHVVVIPGDDAAPEAMSAAVRVLRAAASNSIDWEVLPDGYALASKSLAERQSLVFEAIARADAVLFGATSGTTPGIWELRWGRETFANVRPVKWRRGVPTPLQDPSDIDYVIVRENLEDLYLCLEGGLSELKQSGLNLVPWSGLSGALEGFAQGVSRPQRFQVTDEGAYAIKIVTAANCDRIARFAFELACQRKEMGYAGRVTCSSKYNLLTRTDGLFVTVARTVAAEYPNIEYKEYIIDDFARRIVASRAELDVVLLPNLYGDILSDEAAGTIGGLGMAPSGCYGENFAYFESAHGSAPDIAGRNCINPIATLLSGTMLLRYLGETEPAALIEAAIDTVLQDQQLRTPDIGGTGSTTAFGDAIIAAMKTHS
ncbi:MAG: isocitrate/isopropylmalate dehydrogenase family protein [Betaproteobacteria bacterium]|nr:isocitrate/isopropylmalate dehydrogenase family protein [Betaproteobacteria bacterium]